ncbi:hypothetical protein [Campylobacter majalis]|uniref:hypothetical protein n=1 Tax=Campylobacter majalis TaxID=2790656 RepID=UPI003D69B8B4
MKALDIFTQYIWDENLDKQTSKMAIEKMKEVDSDFEDYTALAIAEYNAKIENNSIESHLKKSYELACKKVDLLELADYVKTMLSDDKFTSKIYKKALKYGIKEIKKDHDEMMELIVGFCELGYGKRLSKGLSNVKSDKNSNALKLLSILRLAPKKCKVKEKNKALQNIYLFAARLAIREKNESIKELKESIARYKKGVA